MPWKWYNGTVIKTEAISTTTKRFWVEIPDESIDFRAGQFVTMDLPIHEKRLKRWRSYSIANAPDNSNILEFCIVRFEGGAGSTYLFNEAKEGTTIRFKGPSGAFYLPQTIEKDLVFICTGTGLAPFRSMIWDIYNSKIPHRNIHLIFGTRTTESILYQKEMEAFSKEKASFNYSVALSREEALPSNDSTDFYKGYVHQIYMKEYADARPDVDFYLCGWSNMIDEAVENLILKLGYDKSQIHYELYG